MVKVDLWGTHGRLTRIVWCRTRAAARRFLLERAEPDEVQARVCWPGVERVLVRRDVGDPWSLASERVTDAAGAASGGAE